jgi:hypothetical protein
MQIIKTLKKNEVHQLASLTGNIEPEDDEKGTDTEALRERCLLSAESQGWEDKQIVLALHLECNPDELSEETYDHYGLTRFSLGNQEYAIGTDSEADEAAKEYVKDSVWAFNASFILSECDLPSEMEDAIKALQSDKCEGANDALLALVEKCTTLENFTQSAISADGRGHFLSGYAGDVNEEGDFFIYRLN